MTRESGSLVPSFSLEAEPSRAGAEDASGRLDAFALEHDVSAAVRHRLTAVAERVLTGIAGADRRADRVLVEADIDQGDVQVVFTREMGSAESADAAHARLASLGASCDGFSASRSHTTGIEVWVCFALA